MLQRVLRDKELPPGIQIEHLIIQLLGNILLGAERLHARIVNHNIQPAELLHRLVEQLRHFRSLRHISLNGYGFAAGLLDLRDGCKGWLGRGGVIDDDAGTGVGERDGETGAEAAARARDEGDFAVEAEVGLIVGDGAHGGCCWVCWGDEGEGVVRRKSGEF